MFFWAISPISLLSLCFAILIGITYPTKSQAAESYVTYYNQRVQELEKEGYVRTDTFPDATVDFDSNSPYITRYGFGSTQTIGKHYATDYPYSATRGWGLNTPNMYLELKSTMGAPVEFREYITTLNEYNPTSQPDGLPLAVSSYPSVYVGNADNNTPSYYEINANFNVNPIYVEPNIYSQVYEKIVNNVKQFTSIVLIEVKNQQGFPVKVIVETSVKPVKNMAAIEMSQRYTNANDTEELIQVLQPLSVKYGRSSQSTKEIKFIGDNQGLYIESKKGENDSGGTLRFNFIFPEETVGGPAHWLGARAGTANNTPFNNYNGGINTQPNNHGQETLNAAANAIAYNGTNDGFMNNTKIALKTNVTATPPGESVSLRWFESLNLSSESPNIFAEDTIGYVNEDIVISGTFINSVSTHTKITAKINGQEVSAPIYDQNTTTSLAQIPWSYTIPKEELGYGENEVELTIDNGKTVNNSSTNTIKVSVLGRGTVKYQKSNGEFLSPPEGTVTDFYQKSVDEDTFSLSIPPFGGYKVIGSTGTESVSVHPTTDVAEVVGDFSQTEVVDLTLLVAVRQFMITYQGNGGVTAASEVSSTQSFTVEDTTYLADGALFTRNGFELVSWNTKADGTGTNYELNEEWQRDESTTLYAIWEEKMTSTVNVTFVDEVGDSLHTAIELTGTIGTTIDLTDEDTVQQAIQEVLNANYQLVNSPEPEMAIPVSASETTVAYEFEGKLMVQSAPTYLNFGRKTLGKPFIKVEKAMYDQPLIVWDNRKATSSWTLTATLENPLTSVEDPSKVLPNAIRYKVSDAQTVTLSTGTALPIAVRPHSSNPAYNISTEWDDDKSGVQLEVASGDVIQTGKYRATILWQVAITP